MSLVAAPLHDVDGYLSLLYAIRERDHALETVRHAEVEHIESALENWSFAQSELVDAMLATHPVRVTQVEVASS